MRLTAAVVTFLLLTEAADAAMWRQEKYCPADRKQTYCDPDRKAKQRKIDNAYQKQIKSQPAPAAATNDPWGDLRASETKHEKTEERAENPLRRISHGRQHDLQGSLLQC